MARWVVAMVVAMLAAVSWTRGLTPLAEECRRLKPARVQPLPPTQGSAALDPGLTSKPTLRVSGDGGSERVAEWKCFVHRERIRFEPYRRAAVIGECKREVSQLRNNLVCSDHQTFEGSLGGRSKAARAHALAEECRRLKPARVQPLPPTQGSAALHPGLTSKPTLRVSGDGGSESVAKWKCFVHRERIRFEPYRRAAVIGECKREVSQLRNNLVCSDHQTFEGSLGGRSKAARAHALAEECRRLKPARVQPLPPTQGSAALHPGLTSKPTLRVSGEGGSERVAEAVIVGEPDHPGLTSKPTLRVSGDGGSGSVAEAVSGGPDHPALTSKPALRVSGEAGESLIASRKFVVIETG